MQPFPQANELQRFVGDAIEQVSFVAFGVHFSFQSKWRLAAEYRVEHVEPDGTLWSYDCKAAEGPPLILHRLLSYRIVSVAREDLRLTFRMQNGSSLSILTEIGPYESGQIEDAESHLTVF